jgi:SagB-type dehydrogenase family enzyme
LKQSKQGEWVLKMFCGNRKAPFGLLNALRSNICLGRRQACEIGVLFGLAFFVWMPLKVKRVFAKREKSYKTGDNTMDLTPPMFDGSISLEKAIKQRRTIRSFRDKPITIKQFSQILWAAQGITDDGGFKRASPSAGALYPLDIWTVVGRNAVENLDMGVYHYKPRDHSIKKATDRDLRKDVAIASLSQMWMAKAPVLFVITAEYARVTIKYGDRGIRYAQMEVGHSCQNIFLQCQTMGLSAGIVGAFHDRKVAKIVGVAKNHEPLIIMPVGWQA